MEKHRIYADCAAASPLSERALLAAMPFLTEAFGNAGSVHSLGMRSARAVFDARKKLSELLGCDPRELFFTSGGTESDNWALRSAAELGEQNGKRHIVTTAVEHHAVLHTCAYLERRGFEVTYLPPDKEGRITASQVADAVREDTALVSVMYANNEVGVIYPIGEIAEACRKRGVLFHTDAVQAAGHEPISLRELGADMLSLSGHKFGAMKGIGALYVREGVKLPPFMLGGAQESGLRAGTENVPGIVSMAAALEESLEDLADKNRRLSALRDRVIDGLLEIEGSALNGARDSRLAGNVSVSFEGIESESLVLMLDIKGIQASGGSACTSHSPDPSHVLLAMGQLRELAKGSLRLSFSPSLTDGDAEAVIATVTETVKLLRANRS